MKISGQCRIACFRHDQGEQNHNNVKKNINCECCNHFQHNKHFELIIIDWLYLSVTVAADFEC